MSEPVQEIERGWLARWWRPLLLLLVIVSLAVGSRFVDVRGELEALLRWVDRQGAWGPFVFIAIYVVGTVLFVPGLLLTLGAGVLFGIVMGTVWVSIGSTLGAGSAFLVARYLARDRVAAWIEERGRFRAIDEAVTREGWKIVGLIRLSPVFPFNLQNYAFGLTGVPFWHYLAASWIGMLPGTLLYVYVGALAGDIAGLGAERGERTPAEWAFLGLGLVATLAVTVYVTHVARKALTTRVREAGGDG